MHGELFENRHNGQFGDKHISFEMPFLGKWQKRVILIFAFYDKSMNFGT